jgi:Concanavalin A-like lectin/glucanases superfamily
MGGLYTEAAPESLPMGASPCAINCDFILGSVLQRPGKESAFYYSGFMVTENTNSAITAPGKFTPNEVPWTTPANAELDIAGTYASVSLNSPVGATFLGTSVYVSTTNSFPFNYGVTQSVSFEFKTTTTLGGVFIQANVTQLAPFIVANVTGTAPRFAVLMNTSGNLEAAFFNTASTQFSGATAAAYNDGNLHTCFVTLNAGTMTIYVDGVNVLSGSFTPGSGTGACYWIMVWGANFFPGWPTFAQNITTFMSNVAVWHDLVITGTQIAQVQAGTISLASLSPDSIWLFEDALSSTTAIDTLGNNNGTYETNTPMSLFESPAGGDFDGIMGITFVVVIGQISTWTTNGFIGAQNINIGDTILAMAQMDPIFSGGKPQIEIIDLVDNFGNTYAQIGQQALVFDPGGGRFLTLQMVSCQSTVAIAAGAAVSWTVTINSGNSGEAGILDQFNVCSIPSITTVSSVLTVTGTIPGTNLFASGTLTITSASLLVCIAGSSNTFTSTSSTFVTVYGNSGGNSAFTSAYLPQAAGSYASTYEGASGEPFGTMIMAIGILAGRQVNIGSIPYSQVLQCINYPFAIPSTQSVIGFEVAIYGNQSTTDSNAFLTVNLAMPAADSPTFTGQLPSSDGVPLTFGGPTANFGLSLSPATFNNPNFGIYLYGQNLDGTETSFFIYAVKITVWLTPFPPPSFNYLKTFAQTDGGIINMAVASDGIFYQEDAVNDPGVLTAVYEEILPNSFAESATVDDREFIAISNLENGTDLPYTYDGTNFYRLSQVGPGAPPSCISTSAGSPITTITQQPAFAIPSHATGPYDSFIGVSASSADHGNFGTPSTPGNVCTIVLNKNVSLPSYMINGQTIYDFTVGGNIVLSGCPTVNGNVINNDPTGATTPAYYTITSIGQPITGQTYYDAITFTVNFTTFGNANTLGNNGVPAGITIESTIATLTASVQVPNLEVGDNFTIAGSGGAPPGGYDGSWQVLATPNAANLLITSTELLNNVATYGFVLETGVNPVVGQAVTVTLTLNGNGVFNVANAIITSVTAGTFSVSLPGANIVTAAEDGAALIFGTIFQFDAFQIIGNKTGGTISSAGVIGVGQRVCCYSFLTVDGYITLPSPTFTFDVTSGASNIAVTNLLPGPTNVIARIIFFTAASGGQFYWIPSPVQVVVNGVTTTYSATIINDNVSTQATLSFPDTVLTAADEIDIQGNNLFANYELGSCVAVIPYAQRLVAIGEQNKIFNMLNYSFDGGVGVITSAGGSTSTYPAGWTVDPVNGTGGSMIASSRFGFSYQISNQTGSTQALYGMITQPMYQDQLLVAIIQPSTAYSIRVTVSVPFATASGNLVIDLYSKSIGKQLGVFSLPLSTIGTTLGIYTGTLLTTTLSPVPNDLVIRIYAQNILTATEIVIDRIEPFPTLAPNLNTQVILSYQQEFEQFDRNTGVILATQQNQQPVVTAFTLYGNLYLLKTGSFIAFSDNPSTEPGYWNEPRTVSNSVGALGVYAVTTGIDEPNTGEEWAVIAAQSGAFIFQGQQPIKISEEIQSVWNQINFAYAYTVWVKNDVANRRILIGVPLNATDSEGNVPAWLPEGILEDETPTTPNCILEMSYKSLNTAGAVESSEQIHRSYSGKLIASEIVRKWNIWSIKAPCAAFLTRDDTTNPLFVGNSDFTGKIYELVPELLEDDGQPIYQLYTTAGFVPSETGQGIQIGVTRFTFEYMTMVIDGTGSLTITAYPNSLETDYVDVLLPNLTLPASTDGDTEVPVNETGNRLFMQYSTNAVGAGFQLIRVVMVMTKETWAPTRGING